MQNLVLISCVVSSNMTEITNHLFFDCSGSRKLCVDVLSRLQISCVVINNFFVMQFNSFIFIFFREKNNNFLNAFLYDLIVTKNNATFIIKKYKRIDIK